MKTTIALVIVLLVFAILAAGSYAQSPREQLNQMVEQLQKTPSDNALREKIIKLSITIQPAPAIPEEAREPFVMGGTVLKKASNPAEIKKALELFTQALNIAPWFADAYYNRALAREAAGQIEPAIDDLKLYLEFKLSEAERREAQDKIYSLKADGQLASARKTEQDKIARADEEKRLAEQAKRDVITKIKNAVNNRNYQLKILSFSSTNWLEGGVTQYELFGGGKYYMHSFDFHIPIYWKFFDEQVELWGIEENRSQELLLRGESRGPKVADMRWSFKDGLQQWAHFDLQNGYLYCAGTVGARPVNDSEFDPTKRYAYVLYKPVK